MKEISCGQLMEAPSGIIFEPIGPSPARPLYQKISNSEDDRDVIVYPLVGDPLVHCLGLSQMTATAFSNTKWNVLEWDEVDNIIIRMKGTVPELSGWWRSL